MKKRIGFVSNSSSSSFMVGIGVVTNWTKFNKWKKTINNPYDIQIYKKEDTELEYASLKMDYTKYIAEAPVNDSVTVELSLDDYESVTDNLPKHVIAKNLLAENSKENIVVYSMGNDEGDSAFNSSSDWGDINYNIGFDWFSQDQRRIYEEFGSDKSGISFSDKTYGAGRNG